MSTSLQVWLANILRTHFFWGTYLKLHQSNPQPFAINSYRCCCRCQPEARSESKRRMEGNCQAKSSAKGQSCMKIDLFGFKTSLSAQEGIPPTVCRHSCHTTLNGQFQHPFAFEIFINPALSVLPKLQKPKKNNYKYFVFFPAGTSHK